MSSQGLGYTRGKEVTLGTGSVDEIAAVPHQRTNGSGKADILTHLIESEGKHMAITVLRVVDNIRDKTVRPGSSQTT